MNTKKSEARELTLACRACARCPICQVSDEEWEEIDGLIPAYRRARGVLFREGERPQGVYVICAGQIKQWYGDERGRRFLWRTFEAGEVLGAITLLAGRVYPTTAEMVEPCWLRFIPRRAFFALLEEYRGIERALLGQMAQRLYEVLGLLRTFTLSRTAVERLAWLLYRLWVEEGGGEAEVVRLAMSRQEMAERIGVEAVETVSRLLRRLVEAGLIERERGVTLIRDAHGLRRLCERERDDVLWGSGRGDERR